LSNCVFLCVKISYVDVDLLELILIDYANQSIHHMTIFGL